MYQSIRQISMKLRATLSSLACAEAPGAVCVSSSNCPRLSDCLDLTKVDKQDRSVLLCKRCGPFGRVVVEYESTLFCPRVLAILTDKQGVLEVKAQEDALSSIKSALADVGLEFHQLRRSIRSTCLVFRHRVSGLA